MRHSSYVATIACVSMLGASLLCGSSALAAEPTTNHSPTPLSPEAAKAFDLVHDLGDPSFRVREAASRELRNLGGHAKPALLAGVKSPDPEIWNRCAKLLPEAVERNLQMRIDAYIADEEGKQKHDLPLVAGFQRLAGNDVAARRLFGSIVKKNADFLEACERDPAAAGKKFADRLLELQQRIRTAMSGVGPVDIAALVLVESDPKLNKKVAIYHQALLSLTGNGIFFIPMRQGKDEQAIALRKLYLAWTGAANDAETVNQCLILIRSARLNEGADFALKVMKCKKQSAALRNEAMLCLGQLAGNERLADFEAMFDESVELYTHGAVTTQIKDVALAMAIRITGQNLNDFGFDGLSPPRPRVSFDFTAYKRIGFTTEQKREAAFKKYRDWQEDHK